MEDADDAEMHRFDNAFNLTEEEKQELHHRPVQLKRNVDFTDAQYALRLSIAKKFHAALLPGCPDWARPIYEKRPMWDVYRYKNNGSGVIRACGVDKENEEGGHEFVKVISGHFFMNAEVFGGINVDELEPWPRRIMLSDLLLYSDPGIFVDPLGFWLCISHFHAKN